MSILPWGSDLSPQGAEDALELVLCNLCGAYDYAVVYRSIPPRGLEEVALSERFAASSGFTANEQVVRCRRCGLVYMNPRINCRMIVEGYARADNSTYLSQGEGRLRTFRRGVRLLSAHAATQKGRLLDVGSAGGFFLKAAQEAGWEVYGIEPSAQLCEFGLREFDLRNIRQGTLHDVHYPDNFFDAVTYWDVLEHVPDPAQDLAEVFRIIRPGGIFLVNYPDFSSIWARLLRRKWWFLLSVHLYYFTPTTIGELLQKTGFSPFYSRMHFQNLSFGYLLYRFKAYSPTLASVLSRAVRTLRLEELQLLYYASQTTVLARKVLCG